jgi:hypothetical protein
MLKKNQILIDKEGNKIELKNCYYDGSGFKIKLTAEYFKKLEKLRKQIHKKLFK